MSKLIVDSWAWVEYLRGGKHGATVRREMENCGEVQTHLVTVAELVSKFEREHLDANAAYKAITALSKIFVPGATDARDAGILHASVKARRPSFSLADAFVLQAAKKLRAKVLTGEPDFRGVQEAIIVR